MWQILAVEYYSGIKMNGILIHDTAGMSCENIMFNEIGTGRTNV